MIDMVKNKRDEITALYENGCGAREIIEKLNLPVSAHTLRYCMRNYWGVKMRSGGHAAKIFECPGCGSDFTKNASKARLCQECAPTRAWDLRFVKYGITKPQFDELYEKQSGLCDLCELPLPDDPFKVCVDHCHKQGHTRGLLCPRCNIGLGYIENDKFVGAAVKYIERHRI